MFWSEKFWVQQNSELSFSKQQKPYQGTLRTQELTPIGSETSLGPSMDPTGLLKIDGPGQR